MARIKYFEEFSFPLAGSPLEFVITEAGNGYEVTFYVGSSDQVYGVYKLANVPAGYDPSSYQMPTSGSLVKYTQYNPDGDVAFRVSGIDVDIDMIFGTSEALESDALQGADRLIGCDADDLMRAYGGSDVLLGKAGADKMFGGAGSDELNGGDGADVMRGGGGSDYLLGKVGADEMFGGAGSDELNGGDGADLMRGGRGNDYYRSDQKGDRIVEDKGEGRDTVATKLSAYKLGANLENLTLLNSSHSGSGSGDESFAYRYGDGNGLDNVIKGATNAANILRGNGGADRLIGSEEFDDLRGGTGNDVAKGFGGGDSLSGGNGRDNLMGGSGSDILFGDGGADNLSGGNGVDSLYGGGGDDDLFGNNGGDLVYGEAGDDRLRGNDGNDLLFGGAGNDDLRGGSGQDELYGNGGNDQIQGGGGGDELYGDAGRDELNGGNGADDLFGGAGADVFVFEDLGESFLLDEGPRNYDIIYDFEVGTDKIDLRAIAIDGVNIHLSITNDESSVFLSGPDEGAPPDLIIAVTDFGEVTEIVAEPGFSDTPVDSDFYVLLEGASELWYTDFVGVEEPIFSG